MNENSSNQSRHWSQSWTAIAGTERMTVVRSAKCKRDCSAPVRNDVSQRNDNVLQVFILEILGKVHKMRVSQYRSFAGNMIKRSAARVL